MTKPFIYTDVWKSCIFVLYKKKKRFIFMVLQSVI